MKKLIEFGLVLFRVIAGPVLLLLGFVGLFFKMIFKALEKTFGVNPLFGAIFVFSALAFGALFFVKSQVLLGEFWRFVVFSDPRDLRVLFPWVAAYLAVGVFIVFARKNTQSLFARP